MFRAFSISYLLQDLEISLNNLKSLSNIGVTSELSQSVKFSHSLPIFELYNSRNSQSKRETLWHSRLVVEVLPLGKQWRTLEIFIHIEVV